MGIGNATLITDLYNYILNYNAISQKNQQFLNISVTFNHIFFEFKISAHTVAISDSIINGLLHDNISKLFANVSLIRGERLIAQYGIYHLISS